MSNVVFNIVSRKTQCSGGLEVKSVQKLARIAQGEDSMSGLYNIIADGIITVSSFIFNNYLLVD